MPIGAAGTTIILEAIYQDGTGSAVVPTTPLVDILDPNGITVVNNAVPSSTPQVGRYEYNFVIPSAGPLGAWTARWSGVINSANVESSEVFTVVEAGNISFDSACSWDPIPCGCDLDLEDESTVYAVETASYILWALSGRQFGCNELTVRPCKRDCLQGSESGEWGARLVDGQWINLSCRNCSGPCACSEVCELRLPHAPAHSVTSVILDGVSISSALWRLEDREWLVLDPSAGCFPACQDMSLRLGEVGTYGVTWAYGTPPPVAGRRAVGALACEILKACRNDSSCCLPKRTQSFNRQGITAVMLDPFEFFDRKRTGIYEVDLFLLAANPEGRVASARILSPDMDPRRRDDSPWVGGGT